MAIDFSKIPSPCYVIETKLLKHNLEILKYVQDEAQVKILCALKGFAMHSVFPIVRSYLSGATASSLFEAKLCIEKMGSPAHLCCPVYLENDLDEMISLSSHITFNSIGQYERYRLRVQQKSDVQIAIRVNPEYSEIETALYNPAVPGSRLGVMQKAMPLSLPEGVTGLHFHVLCENDSYTLERTLQKVEEKFDHLIKQCSWINFGGGHHITRKDYDVEHLIGLLKSFKQKYPNIKELILEPGEAVGWQTGYLVSTVQDLFISKGVQVAMLDVSFTAHMPDCLEMPYKPRILGATDVIEGKPTYRMGGMSCLAGDFMGDYSFDKELKIGDKIIFDDMIHYTMVKTTMFNGVNLPAIGIWQEDDTFDLVRSFSYEDYKNRLS